jgi:hypothetical protein
MVNKPVILKRRGEEEIRGSWVEKKRRRISPVPRARINHRHVNMDSLKGSIRVLGKKKAIKRTNGRILKKSPKLTAGASGRSFGYPSSAVLVFIKA